MCETFLNDFKAEVYGKIPEEQMNTVIIALSVVCDKYKIEVATQELSTYRYQLPECYKAYLVTRKIEGLSAKTIQLYKLYLEHFLTAVPKPVNKITANDIRVYLYKVQEDRGMGNRSLDSRRSCLSAFFNWLAANEYIDRNPCSSIKPIKYDEKPREPLSDTEMELVRESCVTVRERAIVEILYSTACRVSELEGLKLKDVNLTTGEVLLFGKGSKYRSSYMSDCALLYLKKYLESRDDDTPNVIVSDRRPHKALSKEGIEKVIRDIGKRCGIERLHPHLFRHSSATNLLRRGMDVTQIRDLLGHTNVNTTMIYAHVDKQSMRENHRRYIS